MGHPRNIVLIVSSIFYYAIVPAITHKEEDILRLIKNEGMYDTACALGVFSAKYCEEYEQKYTRSDPFTIVIKNNGIYDTACALGVLSDKYCEEYHLQQKEYEQKYSRLDPFKIVTNSLSYNKYAFLTSHDSYPTYGRTYSNYKGGSSNVGGTQGSVTQQLKRGVRALMWNSFGDNDVYLCHKCEPHINRYIGFFSRAIDLLKEVEAFLTLNPSEVVTLILEDRVSAPNGLAKVFGAAGLTKYLFPLNRMPRHGGDWPSVKDMVAENQRLVVFTSNKSKEESEGIAYKWNYMVEYKYGRLEGKSWSCTKSGELLPLDNTRKSLILLNYHSIPYDKDATYGMIDELNAENLKNALRSCYRAASNRWPNFIAVEYEENINVEPASQATAFVNGKLLCGCDDVKSCEGGSWCASDSDLEVEVLGCGVGITSIKTIVKYTFKPSMHGFLE